MPTFTAQDGTKLAYHVAGTGEPLVCLPGGPMQDSEYLGDLGGLAERRRLIRADPRGTGESGVPADPASYRCDRLVADVEALREHLGLDRMDLLAHSGGANLAVSYAARHPGRVRALVLVTPGPAALGVAVTGEDRMAAARLREGEPWYGEARAALERIVAGRAGDGDWAAVEPFRYGRWDDAARAHLAAQEGRRNDEAAAVFASEGAFDPPALRAALTALDAPVLVLAGEADLNTPPRAAAEIAALFPRGELVVQAGAGHFPWLHDPAAFTAAVAAFLR
ncbi:alpha/beta fold hydrolase [Bailinhaonella thermotolerans]|uniref:Alpha/beta hydrolase n=1 Tax=Bailinhaonella thermotolerans TaxID=1070861 RepID=A0A3A4AJB7_9ACTN|nr:alpha/beta hydrolase [Bailinhaonella thermotolerans]RJL27174.1 alpha/beta hydrolase [Bailinhaonella thermotolerans]